ncbi:EbsA family protein [Gordonia sp. OPL2]|uniref:EbsA family protein n=1 Tax=Gordonia sp. OPL2 TaxID=2486274 RepID=UPI0021CC5634|nr:EbsA family protein [Gordonia sp. OPL2]
MNESRDTDDGDGDNALPDDPSGVADETADAGGDTATPGDTSADDTSADDESATDEPAADPDSDDDTPSEPIDDGELLFYEPGGSWWVVAIGPVLIGAVLAMEIAGPGQVHWPVLIIFAVILIGFSLVQVYAARTHVSVRLTETTLSQGTRTIPLSDITKILPANNGPEPQTWESARALGELPAVPRRRKGIGVELADGALAQAWARDVERFRTELSEAHQAVRMGLPPRGRNHTGD